MDKIRQHFSLEGEWDFAYQKAAPDLNAIQDEKFDGFPAKKSYELQMAVPGYWDDYEDRLVYGSFWSRDKLINPDYQPFTMPIGAGSPPDMSLPYLVGCGWYRKRFYAEESWKKKSVTLHVGGVIMEAYIWLNGRWIGYHEGHLTPFCYELSEDIVPGQENELLIAVSNTRQDRVGCSIRGNKGKSGGIRSFVFLEITGKQRITDCYVYTDPCMKRLYFNVALSKKQDCEIDWEIRDREALEIAAQGTVVCSNVTLEEKRHSDRYFTVTWESSADGLKPWSDHSPQLYELYLRVKQNGKLEDEKKQTYGFRRLDAAADAFDGKTRILLNGTPIFLRGATEHAYFPKTCTVPSDREYWWNAIKTLKSYGFNWMRFHTWVPPVECLEAADELGMLLQIEAANGFSRKEWLDILENCRIHPSVVLYCCGNEVRMDEEMIPYLEEMAGYMHERVPDALFNPMEGLRGIEYDVDDAHTGFSEEVYRYDRLKKIEKFSDVLAPHGQQLSYHSLDTTQELLEHNLSRFHKPCLMHEAAINDTYLNLDLEKRYEGTRIGTKLYAAVREYTKKMGIYEKTPIYYKNSCLWMKQILKFSLENARRENRINGYDLLGAIDFHWHRSGYGCGFMNEFYELKEGFSKEEIKAFNAESVLLASVGKERNVFGGQKLSIPVQAALYGEKTAEKAILSYYIADDTGKVYDRGSEKLSEVKNYRVSQLAIFQVAIPEVKAPVKVKLWMHFSSEEYELTNAWEYWIYPKEAPYFGKVEDKSALQAEERKEGSGTAEVCVTDKLDGELLARLAKGERVLLLGSNPFPSVKTSFQIMTAGRPQGLNATVIYEHPVTNCLAHEGYCDWQFAPMMEDGMTVVFNDAPAPFSPIMEMVSGYKIIRKQASMFELNVGAGRLFVCSLNLQHKDAGTLYLRSLLEHYVASESFRPKDSITPEALAMWCGRSGIEIDFSTDEGYDVGGHVKKEKPV